MLNEHAITYQDQLSLADLDYIIRKANKLGRLGREVIRVHEKKDEEGTHVFYDVTPMKIQKRTVIFENNEEDF